MSHSAAADLRREASDMETQALVLEDVEKDIRAVLNGMKRIRDWHGQNPSSAFTSGKLDAADAALLANGISIEALGNSDVRDTVGKPVRPSQAEVDAAVDGMTAAERAEAEG